MTIEQEYEETLRRIAFRALGRKMLKKPPSVSDWAVTTNMTQKELWELIEYLGDTAIKALNRQQQAA